jgi:hypothetical protein
MLHLLWERRSVVGDMDRYVVVRKLKDSVISIFAVFSPTSGGRSVGIVRSRTKATEASFSF